MRKIENEMRAAVQAKVEKWAKDNTAVFYVSARENGNPHGDRSEVYLHGNLIAEYWHETGTLEVCSNTLARWPSITTLSRLRALGADVTVKKGNVFLNGVFVARRQ
jgi:5-enolpyruvylshikimate-3-phosphate synthase